MSSPEAECYFALPHEEQERLMVERITAAPLNTEAMTQARLCDREQCSLSVAGVLRAALTPGYAPHLIETREADLAVELAPDCVRFQPSEQQ